MEPGADVVGEAARWLAHLESDDATEQDRADFATWCAANPAHALVVERLTGTRDKLDNAPDVEREALRRLLLRPPRSAGIPLVLLLLLFGASWMVWRLPAVQLALADERTSVGETRVIDLADSSRLDISTQTAVNIDVDDNRRSVTLLRGEVLARVTKRPNDPFVVQTDDGTATALGTAYTVRKDVGGTVVTVAVSRVRTCPRLDRAACLTLLPGQSVRMTSRTVERLADVEPGEVGAWADGWLSAEDRPLTEVLDELNKWRGTPIAFDRGALADLRVSGVFPLRDPDRAVANLTGLLPIVLDESDPAAPVMRRR
ncbi:hypothetical protein MB02_11700 [Croceicoccus estronivorus]|nr:hypothetical protein MB02_11700 [Croceicoccus estronivorus]